MSPHVSAVTPFTETESADVSRETVATAPDELLATTAEAANFLRANPRSMERWRRIGTGPPFIKVGRKVCYRVRDLRAWVAQQRRDHTGASTSPAA